MLFGRLQKRGVGSTLPLSQYPAHFPSFTSQVGKTMREAILGARWWDGSDKKNPGGAVIIGVDTGDPKNPGGLAPKPDYVIQKTDNIIFLSKSSMSKPETSEGGGGGEGQQEQIFKTAHGVNEGFKQR